MTDEAQQIADVKFSSAKFAPRLEFWREPSTRLVSVELTDGAKHLGWLVRDAKVETILRKVTLALEACCIGE